MLDCDHDKIRTVMKEAQAVGMMTAYHNYLITNMVGIEEIFEKKTIDIDFRICILWILKISSTVEPTSHLFDWLIL